MLAGGAEASKCIFRYQFGDSGYASQRAWSNTRVNVPEHRVSWEKHTACQYLVSSSCGTKRLTGATDQFPHSKRSSLAPIFVSRTRLDCIQRPRCLEGPWDEDEGHVEDRVQRSSRNHL